MTHKTRVTVKDCIYILFKEGTNQTTNQLSSWVQGSEHPNQILQQHTGRIWLYGNEEGDVTSTAKHLWLMCNFASECSWRTFLLLLSLLTGEFIKLPITSQTKIRTTYLFSICHVIYCGSIKTDFLECWDAQQVHIRLSMRKHVLTLTFNISQEQYIQWHPSLVH